MFLSYTIILTILTNAWANKPHIIFIIADDLGWNDVGFHGSSQISTPNIDALAYHGIILNNHYVQPECTPSRAALMTGNYPIHLGMQRSVLYAGEPRALPHGKILPNYLKDLGYSTNLVGKWHLGYSRLNETPTYRGFDSHLGFWVGTSYYDHVLSTPPIPPDGKTVFKYGHDMRRNTMSAWDLQGHYATDIFTDEAVRLINHHDKSKPLFLMLAHAAPHAGNIGQLLEAPRSSTNKHNYIRDTDRRTYAGMVSRLDDSVGKVVQTLKLNNMLQKSIIIFISDNGAPTLGIYSNWGSNYPLRGIKGSLWEGAVRSVAAIWSPFLKERGVSKSLFHVTDWLPTLLSAAGGNLSKLKIDGVNQWPMLLGQKISNRDGFLYNIYEKIDHGAIRRGNWKLLFGRSPELLSYDGYYGENGTENKQNIVYNITDVRTCESGEAISSIGSLLLDEDIMKTREEATVRCPEIKSEFFRPCDIDTLESVCLFDLATDPCERNDLSSLHEDLVEEMKNDIKEFYKNLIPERNVPTSSCGFPEFHNYTWSTFMDNGNCVQ